MGEKIEFRKFGPLPGSGDPHLSFEDPTDGIKDYWDKKLLEAAKEQGLLTQIYKPKLKKLKLLNWLRSWFADMFDGKEGDEWDE